MSRLLTYLVIGLAAIVVAGPTLVSVSHALVPLVVAMVIVAVLLRVVWYFTNRY